MRPVRTILRLERVSWRPEKADWSSKGGRGGYNYRQMNKQIKFPMFNRTLSSCPKANVNFTRQSKVREAISILNMYA